MSRIDHVHLSQDYLIKMHQHHNDEILSYIYKGEMRHRDTEDNEVVLTLERLMVMNAGHEFYHEESMPDAGNEMLQILIRPEKEDLEPDVQFWEREVRDDAEWNLIAGPSTMGPPMRVRNEVAVFDVHGKAADAVTANREELTSVKLKEDTILVLFRVKLGAPMTLKGNFSGHKRNDMKRYGK